jgi:hypothetical protein
MTEPYGIDVLAYLHMGVRVDFHKENPVIFCQSCPYALLGHRSVQCARTGSDEKSSFLRQRASQT